MAKKPDFSIRVLAMLGILLASVFLHSAFAESVDPPLASGGFGTRFQQGDITVSSEVPLSVDIGAANAQFMDITVKGVAANASLEINGLKPSAVYYVYLDDFKNLTEYTTTEDGSLSLSFALVEALPGLPNLRHVMIQDERSTLFLTDDATGGDCTSIGNWEATTKTCTLTQTVTQTIQIDADGVKLDCNDQIIQKGSGYYGVNVAPHDDNVVKNCIVQGGWGYGIVASVNNRIEISNNRVDGATYVGINVDCLDCRVVGNTITNGERYGLQFAPFGYGGSVADNTILTTKYGWEWNTFYFHDGCSDSWYNNMVDGKEVLYLCDADGDAVTNTDAYATIGVFSSDGVTISDVIFPGGNAQAIFLADVTNSTIEGIDTGSQETEYGIQIYDSIYESVGRSDNVIIRNNNLHNVSTGILARPPTDNPNHHSLIKNNTVTASVAGINLQSDLNTVVGNDVGGTLTGTGITSYNNNNAYTANNVHDNKVGVYIATTDSVFRDNTITGNVANVDFGVNPTMPLNRLDVDFDATNLVEGKSVLLLKSPVEQTITGDWAMIVIHSGYGVTIQDVTTANNNADSITLIQTNNSRVVGNTVGSANVGIHIAGGHNNQIDSNVFVTPVPPYRSDQATGVFLNSTSQNVVADNAIDGYCYGVQLQGSYGDVLDNLVDSNVITKGTHGGCGLFHNGGQGISLGKTSAWLNSNNTILRNEVNATDIGVSLVRVTNSLVDGNIIHGANSAGLRLYNGTGNTIINNLFYGQLTTNSRGDVYSLGSTANDNRFFGNDLFSGIAPNSSDDLILCDPDSAGGIGNFFDRSVPAERTRYGPCGIEDTPFTEAGLAMVWQAVEQCRDGRDNDGDSDVDLADSDCYGNSYTELEGLPCTDTDEDGYAYNGGQCGPVDCDDNDAAINPDASEICLDTKDNNCNGLVDECTAEDNVQALIEKLQSTEVSVGAETSLVSKLDTAIKSLDKDNQAVALNQLAAFENEVEAQRGKHLTEEQADYLLGVVANIRADISAGA
jgi:parallel beta-helix repeat protein